MADNKKFRRPPKIKFDPLEQEEVKADFKEIPDTAGDSQYVPQVTKAEEIVNNYSRTVEYMKWLESLVDNRLKDVSVVIDPEDKPEVWMAMQRIFNNPDTKIDYRSYVQVLAALEESANLQADEAMPAMSLLDEFIDSLPSAGIKDDPTLDMTGADEDTAALEEALLLQTVGFEATANTLAARNTEAIRIQFSITSLTATKETGIIASAVSQAIGAHLALTLTEDHAQILNTLTAATDGFKVNLHLIAPSIEQLQQLITVTLAGDRDDQIIGL